MCWKRSFIRWRIVYIDSNCNIMDVLTCWSRMVRAMKSCLGWLSQRHHIFADVMKDDWQYDDDLIRLIVITISCYKLDKLCVFPMLLRLSSKCFVIYLIIWLNAAFVIRNCVVNHVVAFGRWRLHYPTRERFIRFAPAISLPSPLSALPLPPLATTHSLTTSLYD